MMSSRLREPTFVPQPAYVGNGGALATARARQHPHGLCIYSACLISPAESQLNEVAVNGLWAGYLRVGLAGIEPATSALSGRRGKSRFVSTRPMLSRFGCSPAQRDFETETRWDPTGRAGTPLSGSSWDQRIETAASPDPSQLDHNMPATFGAPVVVQRSSVTIASRFVSPTSIAGLEHDESRDGQAGQG
jgi:hypothetical protein